MKKDLQERIEELELLNIKLSQENAKFKEFLNASPKLCDAQRAAESLSSTGAWVEWDGGSQPEHGSVIVEVRFRDGYRGIECFGTVGEYTWEHEDCEEDIIAYRHIVSTGE